MARVRSMSGVELALAFLAGVDMGISLDRWLLPPLVGYADLGAHVRPS